MTDATTFLLPGTDSTISEKRRRSRTSLSTELLSVATIAPDGQKTSGHVFDLSATGLGLFFDFRTDPDYAAGSVLWLRIKSPFLREPIVAPAQIRRVTGCEFGRLYGFQLLEWPGLVSQIPSVAARVFNRRSEHRVKLDSDRPIQITLPRPPASPWERVFQGLKGALMEVSPMGLSFRVGSEIADQIEPHLSAEVSFTLPDSTYEFSIWTEIMRCASRPDGLNCGVRFDAKRTECFKEKQERLLMLLG